MQEILSGFTDVRIVYAPTALRDMHIRSEVLGGPGTGVEWRHTSDPSVKLEDLL